MGKGEKLLVANWHGQLKHCWEEDECTGSLVNKLLERCRGVAGWFGTRRTFRRDPLAPQAVPVALPGIIRIWGPWLKFTRWVGITPLQVANEAPFVTFQWQGVLRGRILLLLFLFFVCLCVSLITLVGSFSKPMRVVVENFLSVLYFSHCIITCSILLRRGKNWVSLFEKWVTTEQQLNELGISEGLPPKCHALCVGICAASFLDNLLYLLSLFLDNSGRWVPVRQALTDVPDKAIVIYFGNHTYLYGLAEVFTEVWAEMTWILADLWIMLCAVVLRHYHGRFNQHLRRTITTHGGASHAIEELRQTFTLLADLTADVNQVLQPLLVLAVGTNLIYFLGATYSGLVQELTQPDVMQRVTFTVVCVFLLLRLQGTCILAALIPEEVMNTREILLQWPTFLSAEERPLEEQQHLLALERFVLQTNVQPGELRGYGFFSLTKTFVAALVSTIVTYELIMFQLPRKAT